ncbi:putative alpha/Beta hydrolase [Plasmopara halstedii]
MVSILTIRYIMLPFRVTFIASAVLLTLAVAQHVSLYNKSGISWPSLRFHFTIKRAASKIHGYSKFSVFAHPIISSNATSVLYNTFVSFGINDALVNYSLVDGIEYVSRSSLDGSENRVQINCIERDVLLPINSIVAALNEAERVSTTLTSDGSAISCPGGSTYKASVNGIHFGVCFTENSGLIMYGTDLDIQVEYVVTDTPIFAPTIRAMERRKCKKKLTSIFVTSIGKALLTGQHISIGDARKLKVAFDFSLSQPSCSCKSKLRPCIFIHGLGSLVEEKENLDSFHYWGNLTDRTPCCSSTKFAVLNTLNNSWTDSNQQQKVCDHILRASNSSNGTNISDTIIVSHSMGGLLVAGAVASGKCRIDNSSTWVSTGTPILGSMASDYFQESCKDKTNLFMEKFVETTGFCPADDGIKSLAYINESYCNPTLIHAYMAAQQVYRENVYALMCSSSFSGIISSYQVGFWLLGRVVSHKSLENDGMVEFLSCAGGFPRSKFGMSYSDRFYMSSLNHFDVAFRAGDALLDPRKMPVKWLECLL